VINQQDRIRLLDEALARAIPASSGWTREAFPATRYSDGETTYCVEVRSPQRPDFQKLSIVLRHDGDIQVEYHIADRRGSPFEMLIVLPEGEEVAAIEVASHFVADLVAERLVLVITKGFFRGGNYFLNPTSLTESDRRNSAWIASWLGTFDWPTPH